MDCVILEQTMSFCVDLSGSACGCCGCLCVTGSTAAGYTALNTLDVSL